MKDERIIKEALNLVAARHKIEVVPESDTSLVFFVRDINPIENNETVKFDQLQKALEQSKNYIEALSKDAVKSLGKAGANKTKFYEVTASLRRQGSSIAWMSQRVTTEVKDMDKALEILQKRYDTEVRK